jgi:hypothetical protein
VLVVLVLVVARTQLCARARGQGRATHLIYSSPFVSPSRAQEEEGSHLAIGATKAPLAVFERARSAHKKKAEEEGSHLAIGATKAPVAAGRKLQTYVLIRLKAQRPGDARGHALPCHDCYGRSSHCDCLIQESKQCCHVLSCIVNTGNKFVEI